MSITITSAAPDDASELAAVAAVTFPLACPESVAAEDIAAFLAGQLSADRFGEYLTDRDRWVLTAVEDGRIIGYAMLIRRPDGVELSKMYVLPSHHGSGAATALMQSAISWAQSGGAASVWLGVNQNNVRAQRFYRKHGFRIIGTRTFELGAATENDFVMIRQL